MTRFRNIALGVSLLVTAALPALAQTAAPVAAPADPAPSPPAAAATQADPAVPDTGMKKTAPARMHHRTHRHMHAKATTAPAMSPTTK